MTTLDRIIEMQQKGGSDTEIMAQLQNEGISPSEINDSLNQARIKNAVSPPEGTPTQPTPVVANPQGMQASIMATPTEQAPLPQEMSPSQPMAHEMDGQQPMAPPMTPTQPEIYQPQEQMGEQPQDDYYQQTPQAYSQQDYYAPQGGMDTETISEIAEQVATEKINDYKRKTGDIVSFKETIQNKVDDIDDRLKRIEANIDKLQQAIIGKVGELGESNAMIHKDLDNLHGTVSKLMDPLIDNYNELKKISK
ncbi:MAG: hypothetical protein OEL87_03785 [Nanoarchaeota archaeon]|nr:hypothetical protein [Nanoarchaeota archaeon]